MTSVLGLAVLMSLDLDWVRKQVYPQPLYLSVVACRPVFTCLSMRYTLHVAGLFTKEETNKFPTLATTETGRKKTVVTKHTLTRFGDWSGPSRPLSSTCAQGIVVWVHIWRGLAFKTLPCVSADKLTKSPRPRPSVLPNIYWETSANMATRRPSCGARQKTSTGQLDLWHQPDWRSNLHGCRLLKMKKKDKFPRSLDGHCYLATRLPADTLPKPDNFPGAAESLQVICRLSTAGTPAWTLSF